MAQTPEKGYFDGKVFKPQKNKHGGHYGGMKKNPARGLYKQIQAEGSRGPSEKVWGKKWKENFTMADKGD